MVFKLYYLIGSQPARAVLALSKLLNVELEKIHVDLFAGEHHSPEFAKLNPTKTIPVLDHDGFVLHESHAIMKYLCNIQGVSDPYYPSDPKQRAQVDQYLDWFHIKLRDPIAGVYGPLLYEKSGKNEFIKVWKKGINNQELYSQMTSEGLSYLNTQLQDVDFLVNNSLTLADLSLALTVETLRVIRYDFSPYPNVERWVTSVVEHPAHKPFGDEYKAAVKAREKQTTDSSSDK
mmetsp:Transcript_16535/g.18629  ORF Transcript_16535/g.18629 Transcript_16535/m.18629 type:complete len:233 (+) Transcript_16535:60-758(+)